MSYASLMVHLELGHPNAQLLQLARNLAQRFQCGVVGVAACQSLELVCVDGYVYGELIEENREEISREIVQAEAEFRSMLQADVPWLDWHSTQDCVSLRDYLAHEARHADLILTGATKAGFLDPSRTTDTGQLIMQTGRPVLVVPPALEQVQLKRVLIAWKDTRESRRAIYDALPLLKMATDVTVVELATEPEMPAARARLSDVVVWLRRHGVACGAQARLTTGDDAARLAEIWREYQADLVVAGAYGHSRLREWALGGVTQSLLAQTERCVLLSN